MLLRFRIAMQTVSYTHLDVYKRQLLLLLTKWDSVDSQNINKKNSEQFMKKLINVSSQT